jgi:uncharacterized protein (DUF433 family)
MTDYENLLTRLARGGVEFIVVGGVAASAHGSARATEDLDIVYNRSRQNIKRLVESLLPTSPYLRGAPPGLPFKFDEKTVLNGLNFTLTTDLGSLDLLGEITGGGGYEQLLAHSLRVPVFGIECSLLGLDHLIYVKRACGRPKDLEAIAELERILEEQTLGNGATEELSNSNALPGLERTPGVVGGAACISNTRIPVWLLEQARRLGTSEADLLRDYPTLTAQDLANAWVYVRSHREEIEEEIAANEQDDD